MISHHGNVQSYKFSSVSPTWFYEIQTLERHRNGRHTHLSRELSGRLWRSRWYTRFQTIHNPNQHERDPNVKWMNQCDLWVKWKLSVSRGFHASGVPECRLVSYSSHAPWSNLVPLVNFLHVFRKWEDNSVCVVLQRPCRGQSNKQHSHRSIKQPVQYETV